MKTSEASRRHQRDGQDSGTQGSDVERRMEVEASHPAYQEIAYDHVRESPHRVHRG